MRLALALAALAAVFPAAADPLSSYRWDARPVLVFAPSSEDPRLVEQLTRFEAARPAMEERRIAVIVDTEAGSDLRRRFGPDTFTVILVGLDGGEKFRRDGPVQFETLAKRIDRMPMRRREMREGD